MSRLKRGEAGISICILCIILFGAGWTDLCYGKVRNRWLLVGAVLGIFLEGWSFFPAALLFIIPACLLYRMKLMGAGDGKLAALIAGYLGIDAALKSMGIGLAFGAVWSVCRFWRKQNLQLRLTYLAAYVWRMIHLRELTEYENLPAGNGTYTIPLAVCLMAGVYVYVFFSRAVIMGRGLWAG